MRSIISCFVISLVFAGHSIAQETTPVTPPSSSGSVLIQDEVVQPSAGTVEAVQDSRPDDARPDFGALLIPTGDGLQVQSVFTNGPFHQQDFRSGDVVHSIDSTVVSTPADVVEFLKAKKPGEMVTVARVRSGKTDELSVKLMSRKRVLEVSNIEGEPNANISRQYVGSDFSSREAVVRLQQRLVELEAEMKRLRAEVEQLKKK